MAIRKAVSRSIADGTIAQADLADGVGGSNVKLYSVTPQTVSGASGVSVVIIATGLFCIPELWELWKTKISYERQSSNFQQINLEK